MEENIMIHPNEDCTYDIVIKCDTEEQRDLVLEKVDELRNKPCGCVWHKYDKQIAEDRKLFKGITNVFFKQSYNYPHHDHNIELEVT
tara:strand:+ start:195 stop:455 length:261 start_codon:yes stop_codon:yes gene_type:complete